MKKNIGVFTNIPKNFRNKIALPLGMEWQKRRAYPVITKVWIPGKNQELRSEASAADTFKLFLV